MAWRFLRACRLTARRPVYASAQIDEDPIAAGGVYLVRALARDGDNILFTGDDYVLVETRAPENDAIWGRYLP